MFEFRHLAVFVSDLRRAEEYYQDLFRMELIGREAEGRMARHTRCHRTEVGKRLKRPESSSASWRSGGTK